MYYVPAFLLLQSLCQQSLVVEAAIVEDPIVQCHPQYPTICAGLISVEESPPPQLCRPPPDAPATECPPPSLGTESFSYEFVEGLEEGADTSSYSGEEKNKYFIPEHRVDLVMNLDFDNCTVAVADTRCQSCTMCEMVLGQSARFLSADCTNVANGRVVQCEADDPFFYPLVVPGVAAIASRPDTAASPSTNTTTTTDSDKSSGASILGSIALATKMVLIMTAAINLFYGQK